MNKNKYLIGPCNPSQNKYAGSPQRSQEPCQQRSQERLDPRGRALNHFLTGIFQSATSECL